MWLLIIAALAVGFLAHTAPFPFLLERFARDESLWRVGGQAEPPLVYLTFDDGPNPEATPRLLDLLGQADVDVTFFLIDAHITDETAWLVRRMVDEGHGIALHSDTRRLMLTSPSTVAATLTAQASRIHWYTGVRPCSLFRPHGGWRSAAMYAGLKQIDYKLVGWSFGMWDFNWYRRPNPKKLAARLARRASPGAIIVMHDGHHIDLRPDRRYTVEAVRELIPALRHRGFQLGPLCRLGLAG